MQLALLNSPLGAIIGAAFGPAKAGPLKVDILG